MDIIYSKPLRDVIVPDRYFMVVDNKGYSKIGTTSMGKQRLCKQKNINFAFFLGKSINTFYEFHEDEITEISADVFFNETDDYDEDLNYENDAIVGQSNKEIYSDSTKNLISAEEIEKLKQEGQTGEEIIKMLMDNNTTIQKRTLLSKEKITKKKQMTHLYRFWLTDTTIVNVTETLFLACARTIR